MRELHGWLNRNAARAYPLREDGAVVSENTFWRIPTGLIVDLFVVAPGAIDVCITAITVTSRIVSVVIGDPATGDSLATASAVLGEGTPYVRKDLTAIAAGVSGSITFGPLVADGAHGWGPEDHGQHLFGVKTPLETRCVMNPGPFPITALSPRRHDVMNGLVTLAGNDQVTIGLSTGDDDGDPVSLISIDLTDPAGFVSPCETRESPCQCRSMPVLSINGVLPDANGRITLEIVDEFGRILPLGPHILNLLITRTSEDVCIKPLMPDDYGRLPDALGNYDKDLAPVTDYRNPADSTFPGAGGTYTGDSDVFTGDSTGITGDAT